jgi:hypothetical protein
VVDHQIAQVVAREANLYVGVSDRLDRMAERLVRIKRRLELTEAPAGGR